MTPTRRGPGLGTPAPRQTADHDDRAQPIARVRHDGPLDVVLDRLDRVKRNGARWSARCPAHPDKTPSLSIGTGDDGRVLLTCWAGCTVTT